MAVAIWKDYNVTLGSGSSYQFRIKVGDTVIYTGKAYKRPGASSVTVRINDICADYLAQLIQTKTYSEIGGMSFPISFTIQANDSGWTTKATVSFYNDWSYEDITAGSKFIHPINGHYDRRMPIVLTSNDGGGFTASVTYSGSGTEDESIASGIDSSFPTAKNADFLKAIKASGQGCSLFYPSDWGTTTKKFVVENQTFTPVTSCAKYALYYQNAYGGWDALLIEGNDMEADAITRYLTEVEYDNTYQGNRGEWNYVNEIDKTFTLYTGWLLDEQGREMHHLIDSPSVYLYDIANSAAIPVTVADTSCEYKTFKNNGNQLVNYSVSVKLAARRERR